MLSQYTWGQFTLFALVLLVLYYTVVGAMYYRDELSALLKGKKIARGPGAAAGAPAALVRTMSAFSEAPAAGEGAPELVNAAVGASENLPEPVAPLVSGKLPDSAAAKGSDTGTAEEAPMDAEVASAAEQEQQLDEARPDEKLDQADKELAEMIRRAATAQTVAEPTDADIPADGPDEPTNELYLTENNNYEDALTENNIPVTSVEAEIVYQLAEADNSDLFAAFDERLASPLAIIPVTPEPLFGADSLADFLAQVQRGDKPAIPAELLGTSLVDQVTSLTEQSSQELFALFGQEV